VLGVTKRQSVPPAGGTVYITYSLEQLNQNIEKVQINKDLSQQPAIRDKIVTSKYRFYIYMFIKYPLTSTGLK
jgi:hypothetical protein